MDKSTSEVASCVALGLYYKQFRQESTCSQATCNVLASDGFGFLQTSGMGGKRGVLLILED